MSMSALSVRKSRFGGIWCGAVALALALLTGCDKDSPVGPSGPPPTIAAQPSPTPQPTSTPQTNQPPTGGFRINPEPQDGVVRLEAGATLRLNASDFQDPDPDDELKLSVDWGDGTTESVGCGPCRLEHVYASAGSFACVVELSDQHLEDQARAMAKKTESFTVEVSRLPEPVVATFTATPATIDLGGSSTLAWTASEATSCAIDNGVGQVLCDGSTPVSPGATTTYTLTATGPGGKGTGTATVSITPPLIGSFTATPADIGVGGSSTLAWSGITNATTCSIDNGVGAVDCAGGNTNVTPASNTAYTLTATGPGGAATETATVSINPPSIGSFTATPSSIDVSGSSTLAWSGITNATTCSIDNGVGPVDCAGGNTNVTPASNTTYTLTATGPGGTASEIATVSFNAPVAGTLSASPATIDGGGSSTLTWGASTNATSCSIDNGVGTVSCSIASMSVSPGSSTTYTLTATGPGGSDSDGATVTVEYCATIVGVACPVSQTYCLASPISVTNSGHAQAACDACYGNGSCFAGVGGGLGFAGWANIDAQVFFLHIGGSTLPACGVGVTVVPGDLNSTTSTCPLGTWSP
jgi:hypothetical protein